MTLGPGTRLRHFEILGALGAGGMGEVYRAKDTKLGREVALKVLPVQLASDAERLARFEREARAVAAINHPHIVTIHSVDDAAGVHFLTMELVEGQSLDRAIPDGGLPAGRVLDIGRAIADALAAAHEKGTVHRDLKPANVMVTPDGRVKVLDFGLAKDLRPSDQADATLTSAGNTAVGVVMGTPAYMSPEQITGRVVDHRTDLFSLGVILYEMARGSRPFEGASSAELASAILRDTPRPLSEIRTDLPADLLRVTRRLLEKDPGQRVQTARDVVNELGAVRERLASRPPSGAQSRATAPARSPRQAEDVVAIAVLPFADMSPEKNQEYLCEGMAEEIMNALVRVEGIRVASRASAFRARQDGGDLQAIAGALSVGHVLDGSVRTAGTRLRVTAQLTDAASGFLEWSDRFDREASDIFAVQDEIAAGVVAAVTARLAPGTRTIRRRPAGVNLEAYQAYLRGRHLRGKEHLEGARHAFEEAIRLDPSHAPSWTGLAEIMVLSAVFSVVPSRDACRTARHALETAASLQGESADGWHVEAFACWIERRWEEMESAWRRSIELEPYHVLALASFGIGLCTLQRLEEAASLFDRAREADPLASFPYALTGLGYLMCGRLREAERHLENALSFEKEDATALYVLAITKVALGDTVEGIALAERAVAVSHRGGVFLGTLGWACATAGRTADARALLHEMRARPAGSPTVVTEAWLLGALGEIDAAFEVLARAEDEGQANLYMAGVPAFDAVRSDPRFAALLRRLELPPGGRA